MENKFIVVVPHYNAEKWVLKCLKSLKLQEYSNYECIIMDDASTDNSTSLIEKFIKDEDKFTLVRNRENIGPLGNAYLAVMNHTNHAASDDIIVILDGDDFLYSKRTLNILNDCYNSNDCWMTYGSDINLSDRKRGKFSQAIPEYVIDNNLYRQFKWTTSHLRTYKKFLVENVDIRDLKDDQGAFFKAAGDLAMMFPMLEMSREKACYIHDVLYIWNDLNSLNEHKTKRDEQLSCEQLVRNGRKYDKLVRD